MFSDAGVGIFANSACLIADGWHSFGDLCSDLLCWTCHKIGARPADASHPDGYVRYEHIGTLATWFDGPVAPRRRMPPLVKGFVSARRQVSLMSPTRITIIGAIVNMVLATMKIGTSPCQNTGPILPG